VGAWEVGRDAAIEASRLAVLDFVRTRLTVDPTLVESVYCTTVPNLGDGVEFRRNGWALRHDVISPIVVAPSVR